MYIVQQVLATQNAEKMGRGGGERHNSKSARGGCCLYPLNAIYTCIYISRYCILNFSTLPPPHLPPSLDLAANQQGAPSKDLINRLYRPPQASAI
jgi:hypothetical protein